MFASMASLSEAKEDTWMSSNFHTYLVLAKNYDYKKLEAKLPQVVEKYMGPQMQQAMGTSLADFRKQGNDISLHIEPITAIHLDPNFPNELSTSGDIYTVYIFGAIAIFMLVVACINFIILSTASASKRAKEVGVRKVAGSGRGQLISQFLSESLLITLFALLIALMIVKVALPGLYRVGTIDWPHRRHLPCLLSFFIQTHCCIERQTNQ